MDRLLRNHNKLLTLSPVPSQNPQAPKCSPFPKKTPRHQWLSRSAFNRRRIAAYASALLELVPEAKKESLDLDLPLYDSSKSPNIDLAVIGGGPAGLAVAERVAAAGLSVCTIEPSPNIVWPNNYGVWMDEFESIGLLDCLDSSWPAAAVHINDSIRKVLDRPYARVDRRRLKSKMLSCCITNGVRFHQAKVLRAVHHEARSLLLCSDGTAIPASVVLDATGFSRCLVRYDKPYNPGYQVAYGILAEVEEHPFELDKMLFMDWRDSHLDSKFKLRNATTPTFLYAMPFSAERIFLEETSLVARPGLAMADIQERMAARLRHLGIRVKCIEEDEHCFIPMGGPLPVLPQRVIGIGGTAGMVHPSTGYMIARTLAAAPLVADAIVQYLGDGHGGDELAARVWRDLWPIERRRQRDFFCFGMDVLLRLDLEGTRRFFDAFFDLEPMYWHGFLSSRLFLPELVACGLSLFAHASNTCRLEIVAKGTLPLVNMMTNLWQDRYY